MCRGVCAAHFFFVSLRSPGFSPLFFVVLHPPPRLSILHVQVVLRISTDRVLPYPLICCPNATPCD